MKNCNKCVFFEMRKGQDLFMWWVLHYVSFITFCAKWALIYFATPLWTPLHCKSVFFYNYYDYFLGFLAHHMVHLQSF